MRLRVYEQSIYVGQACLRRCVPSPSQRYQHHDVARRVASAAAFPLQPRPYLPPQPGQRSLSGVPSDVGGSRQSFQHAMDNPCDLFVDVL